MTRGMKAEQAYCLNPAMKKKKKKKKIKLQLQQSN